ncbi:carboxymuconolactone decarboxylase family protein [Poriferisphaera sp. WC338]|uniref:carboxymuconolactone decarboxylase family protein n=1 Tax=Poriferisphaera sp. WC338 TaxID=3425129 RepID=UPI003D817943
MPRIEALDRNTAPQASSELLDAVLKKIGMIPNLYATVAHSPESLSGLLGFSESLGKGQLSPQLREQIALTVAGYNGCDYCASAHTAIGKMVGLAEDELTQNLTAKSSDTKSQAALTLATSILETKGHVSNDLIQTTREAGYSNREIIEIFANTIVNIFTNYFNHLADVEIDFPVVKSQANATV